MSTPCPTGFYRHPDRHAAQVAIRRLEVIRPLNRGRRIVVHCPDCDGHHMAVVSKGALRRRNPRQRARLEPVAA